MNIESITVGGTVESRLLSCTVNRLILLAATLPPPSFPHIVADYSRKMVFSAQSGSRGPIRRSFRRTWSDTDHDIFLHQHSLGTSERKLALLEGKIQICSSEGRAGRPAAPWHCPGRFHLRSLPAPEGAAAPHAACSGRLLARHPGLRRRHVIPALRIHHFQGPRSQSLVCTVRTLE